MTQDLMEFLGCPIRIRRNVKVNVLEKVEKLLATIKNSEETLEKVVSEEIIGDNKRWHCKPVRVDVKVLDKKFTNVGKSYDVNIVDDKNEVIEYSKNEGIEVVMHGNIPKDVAKENGGRKDSEGTENKGISSNMDTDSSSGCLEVFLEDTPQVPGLSGSPIIVDDKDIAHLNVNIEDDSSIDTVGSARDTDVSSLDAKALKDLLSDSENKLRDRKMKITSLKISLASMEKKNAEKKLSIQKRDRKIKELEENIRNFRDKQKSRTKESNSQESLELKVVELAIEVDKKNTVISKLEAENKSLRKFKSMTRSLEKELAGLKESALVESNHLDERSHKTSSNIYEDDLEIEHPEESIESISSFLTQSNNGFKALPDSKDSIAESDGKSSMPEGLISHDKSKNKPSDDDSSSDDVIIVTINKDDPNDTITTLSSDDEIDLTREGDSDILLETMLDDHPTYCKDPVTESVPVKKFLTVKPFASLCAKSTNLVEQKKRKIQSQNIVNRQSKQAKLDMFWLGKSV